MAAEAAERGWRKCCFAAEADWEELRRCWAVAGGKPLPTRELGAVMLAAAHGSNTPLGTFVRRTALGVAPARARRLLPLPLGWAYAGGVALGHRRGWPPEAVGAWIVMVILCINFLSSDGGRRENSIHPPLHPNPAQARALREILRKIEWFLDAAGSDASLDEVLKAVRERKSTYGGEVVSTRRTLEAEKVFPAWPLAGEVGRAALEDCLPASVWSEIADPLACLRPRAEWPARPHRSRVYAKDDDWNRIVAEGLRRGIFQEVPFEKVFHGNGGAPVLSGAMGVDKFKDGLHLHRFISILTPLNDHLREVKGEVDWLPFISHALLVDIAEDQAAIVDSEDFTSCFNLLKMPSSWSGFLVYERPVAREVIAALMPDEPLSFATEGGPMYVGITTVPMGWSGAVGVVQAVVRKLVFDAAAVDWETEVAKCKWFPQGPDFSFVYLDSFDFVRVRCKELIAKLVGAASDEHERFTKVCADRGLPLNAGKRLIGSYHAVLQGGEFDGDAGLFGHARDRGDRLVKASLALLLQHRWSESELRSWAGLASFAACYRRPLLSIMEEIFRLTEQAEQTGTVRPQADVQDELLLMAGCVPLCLANLRAFFREEVSMTDASPWGGGALESRGLRAAVARGDAGSRVTLVGDKFDEATGALELTGMQVRRLSGLAEFVAESRSPSAETWWTHVRVSLWELPAAGRTRRARRRQSAAEQRGECEGQSGLARALLRQLAGQCCREGTFILEMHPECPLRGWPRLQALVRQGDVHEFSGDGSVFFLGFGGDESHVESIGSVLVELGSDEAGAAAYALLVRRSCAGCAEKAVPSDPARRREWIRSQLVQATARLADPLVATAGAAELEQAVVAMAADDGGQHVKRMARRADHRGSDVMLMTGEVDRASRQLLPYPAFVWNWEVLSSYAWKATAHINVLEVQAVVDYVRARADCGALQGARFLHVVDSLVTAAVVAKGRSSSRSLNGPLRRLAAILLAADAYPFVVWTISGWNAADAASRRTAPRGWS